MKIRSLSGILLFSRIASVLILLIPVFTLLSAVSLHSSKLKSNDVSQSLDDDTIDKIEYAYIDQGFTFIVFDDGKKRRTAELLTSLCNKADLYKVTRSIAVNPSKGCWYKIDGKPFIKTSHQGCYISERYWNDTFRRIFNQCYP